MGTYSFDAIAGGFDNFLNSSLTPGATYTITEADYDTTATLTVEDTNDVYEDDQDPNQLISGTIDGNTFIDQPSEFEATWELSWDDNGNTKTVTVGLITVNDTPEAVVFLDGDVPPAGTEVTVVSYSGSPDNDGDTSTWLTADAFCFTPGTMIDTPDGPRAVETLEEGALVNTLDHGPQPLRWRFERTLKPGQLERRPNWRPIRFETGAIGNDAPMMLSPAHAVLMTGLKARMLYGKDEILVEAKYLVNDSTIRRMPPQEVTYIHLVFDNHEIVFANGAPCETQQLAMNSINYGVRSGFMPSTAKEELLELFPELAMQDWPAARPKYERPGARG